MHFFFYNFIVPLPNFLCLHAYNCFSWPHQVEFESNLEGKMVQELPEGITNGTGLVFLNHSDPMVDITGKLKYAGRYVFIVHYYQPLYPGEETLTLVPC